MLKREVSPAVRLVSSGGRDGGRDAMLQGPCVSPRYDWTGLWIFQFKHYTAAPGTARSRVLQDFRNGLLQVLALHPDLRNYVLITSVRFTGVPRTGLLDRFLALHDELAADTGVHNLDLWDGNEIDVLLSLHPTIAREFIETRSQRAVVATPHVDFERLLSRDDESLTWALEAALGSGMWVMAPGSDSAIWRAYLSAEYLSLYPDLCRLLARLDDVDPLWAAGSTGRRVIGWFAVLTAVVAAKLGRPAASLEILRRVPAVNPDSLDHEMAAWFWNVRAIALGKLDRHTQHDLAVRKGIQTARACGSEWLARTIELRSIHKADWAASEAGKMSRDTTVDETIRQVIGSGSPDLGREEFLHLMAQGDAYLALHFTWDERLWQQAEGAIRSAQSRFTELGDVAELARMESESGRLALVSKRSAIDAVTDLRSALTRRVRSGELPRVRYDLSYLANALRLQGEPLWAELCLWSAIAVHLELYGGASVDPGIISSLETGLRTSENELAKRAGRQRLEPALLAEMLGEATGLDELDIASMVQMSTLRRSIASGNPAKALDGAK